MSTKSAGLAKKLGYTNIRVMLKGVPGWKKAGQTVVASDAFINKGNIILVDLRSEKEAAAGHIARAVNIIYEDLEDFRDDFSPQAPVVVYGDNEEEAYKQIAKWGVKGVSLIEGGLKGYQARGGVLVPGKPGVAIEWVRELAKGEVGTEEFVQVAEGGSSTQVVLDVRGPEETAAGHFLKAVNIPLDNLEARLGELPKDKEILVHCSTGARAEMAHSVLQKAGYKSRFLVADVACDGTNCTVL